MSERKPKLWTTVTVLIASVAMVAIAACDDGTPLAATPSPTSPSFSVSSPTPTSPPTPEATPTPTAAPTPVEPAAREALQNILKDPMARIAEQVPGFGGVFLDQRQNIVYIYLQDASMQEEAEIVLTEVYGPDFLTGREVQVLEGEYSMAHLNTWYRALCDVVWQVRGISGTDLDERRNRIGISLHALRGVREEMEAAIATVDVPREAIVIDVGCRNIKPIDPGEPPDETFLQAIHYSLDVAPQVPYGETVLMKLTLRNISDAPVMVPLGGEPPHDFVVATLDGEPIWYWGCTQVILSILDGETLEPGEALDLIGEWEQVNNRGEPVPPSVYLVRGVLNLQHPEKLVTPAHEVTVAPTSTRPVSPVPDGETLMFPRHDGAVPPNRGDQYVYGELSLSSNCLRISYADQVDHQATRDGLLVVWPAGFEARNIGGMMEVTEVDGAVVASVGQTLRLSGKKVSRQWAEVDGGSWYGEDAERCGGPFWLVGDEVTAVGEGATGTPVTDDIVFPRLIHQRGPIVSPLEGMEGQLTLRGRCLLLKREYSSQEYFVVWPPGFKVHRTGEDLFILNGGGSLIAKVGDHVTLGGRSSKEGSHYSDECPGAYFKAYSVKRAPVGPGG